MADSARKRLSVELAELFEELEELLAEGAEETSEHLRAARSAARDRMKEVRGRISDLEKEAVRELRHGAERAEHYVRDNPWAMIAVAAGLAFLLGCAVARRHPD